MRRLAVVALVFAALAVASGAFAQSEISETPEEVAGDVDPSDDAGEDDWGEFDEWQEEEGQLQEDGRSAVAFVLYSYCVARVGTPAGAL